MKKQSMKVICLILMLLICGIFLSNVCEASWAIENPELMEPIDTKLPTEANVMVGKLLGILQVIGSVISVITITILGVKYITGSASERAEYKKTMIPYVIGAVLVFSGTILPKIIYDIVTSVK